MRKLGMVLMLGAGVVALSSADRLFNVPTARKLSEGSIRFEYAQGLKAERVTDRFIGIGMNRLLEAEVRTWQRPGFDERITTDLNFNIISPIAGIIPGFAVGVLDALDETPDGRRTFITSTYRLPFELVSGTKNLDLTVGIQAGAKDGFFGGFVAPFTDMFSLMAEHNGYRITAGFEFRPIKPLALRLLVQEERALATVQFSSRF